MNKVKILAFALGITLLAQTLPLGLATFQFERAYRNLHIGQNLYSSTTDGNASIGLGIAVINFDNTSRYGPNDLELNASTFCNSRVGIAYNCTDYSFTNSSCPFGWVDNSQLNDGQGGNLVPVTGDDNGTYVELPGEPYGFTFDFYGGSYANYGTPAENCSVWVSTNGFISFDLFGIEQHLPISISQHKPADRGHSGLLDRPRRRL